MPCFSPWLPVRLCQRKGGFTAATQRPRLRRRFGKPVESRLRVFWTSREGWHNQDDSKSCAPNRGPRAARFHGMECVSCCEPFKTDAETCRAHTGELYDQGRHFRCSERLDRYGNRSARIPANRGPFLLAALHQREGQDRNRFCRPPCGASGSGGARTIPGIATGVFG